MQGTESGWLLLFNHASKTNEITTFSNGYLGSRNDEERSEMRYVMRIAELRESSKFWTQVALPGIPGSMPVSVSVTTTHHLFGWTMNIQVYDFVVLSGEYIELYKQWGMPLGKPPLRV